MKPPPNFRELEVEWLEDILGATIANLGYPVGMGVKPSPEWLQRVATRLFERYARMIEMAAQGE